MVCASFNRFLMPFQMLSYVFFSLLLLFLGTKITTTTTMMMTTAITTTAKAATVQMCKINGNNDKNVETGRGKK